MNTAIVSPTGGSVGIGFAIPSEIVKRIVGQLRSGGRVERGWLRVGDASPSGGVGIDSVDDAGPAARAGLRPGDVVTAVDRNVEASPNALIKAIAALPPGRRVSLTVRRNGRRLGIDITIGRRPAEGAG